MSGSVAEVTYETAVQLYHCLRVTDLDEAIAFYEGVLGFELIWDARGTCDTDELLHVEMSLPCAGARLFLGQAAEGRHGSGALMLCVVDIAGVRARLVAAGVPVRAAGPEDLPSLRCGREVFHYDFFVMTDPFGNEIYFVGRA